MPFNASTITMYGWDKIKKYGKKEILLKSIKSNMHIKVQEIL